MPQKTILSFFTIKGPIAQSRTQASSTDPPSDKHSTTQQQIKNKRKNIPDNHSSFKNFSTLDSFKKPRPDNRILCKNDSTPTINLEVEEGTQPLAKETPPPQIANEIKQFSSSSSFSKRVLPKKALKDEAESHTPESSVKLIDSPDQQKPQRSRLKRKIFVDSDDEDDDSETKDPDDANFTTQSADIDPYHDKEDEDEDDPEIQEEILSDDEQMSPGESDSDAGKKYIKKLKKQRKEKKSQSSPMSDIYCPELPASMQRKSQDSKEINIASTQKNPNVRQKLLDSFGGIPGVASYGLEDSLTKILTPEEEWTKKNLWTVNIRDAKRRTPDDPNYDKTTLYVDPRKLDDLTPFQRQFWLLKKDNFDVVLFFKKGKFYEMYDRDADIGHKELYLNYTGGGRVDMRCVGVPESAFSKHASRLVELGYKVGRVEQTETANMCNKRKATQKQKATVCERQLIKILTKGTANENDSDYDSRYVIALHEDFEAQSTCPETGAIQRMLGVCIIDAAAAEVIFGEFLDDHGYQELETLFSILKPKEVIIQQSTFQKSEKLRLLLNTCSSLDRMELIKMDSFPNVEPDYLVSKHISNAEAKTNIIPQSIMSLQETLSYLTSHPLANVCFAACEQYFERLQIASEVFSLRNFKRLDALNKFRESKEAVTVSYDPTSESSEIMSLDSATLFNLEILENSIDGSKNGSLLSFVDRSITAGGHRLMRKWVSHPLYCIDAIIDRLNAVDVINHIDSDSGGELIASLRKKMNVAPDMERALAKIHKAATVTDNAVMFDDTNKKKVFEFLRVLQGLKSLLEMFEMLHEAVLQSNASREGSQKAQRLEFLLTPNEGYSSEASTHLEWFFSMAFDYELAEKEGQIKPLVGADPEFDKTYESVKKIEDALSSELENLKAELKEKNLKFYSRGKEEFQVEIPEKWFIGKRILPSYCTLTGQSASCRRFYTPKIQELIGLRLNAQEELSQHEKSAVRNVFRAFDKHYKEWCCLAKVNSELDALIGLALASRSDGGFPMCRPKLVLPDENVGHAKGSDPGKHPVLHGRGLVHPILASKKSRDGGTFVPNDVILGGCQAPLVLLTGPNMGGKSTTLRMVCIASILAQIGCYVPASSFSFSPVDAIYTRLGAHDRITKGQSTFLVEMEECSTLLRKATRHSLLILDELGRGTSTYDGYTIAYAAVKHIAENIGCRTLFATHYHMLTETLVDPSLYATYQMTCEVDDSSKELCFLYNFAPGVAPFSRGIHCGRLAGLPDQVADAAEKHAGQLEKKTRQQRNRQSMELLVRKLCATVDNRDGIGGDPKMILQKLQILVPKFTGKST